MVITIFVIVLFAAAVLAHFLVKKERARQVERRLQRVKIAEGNFDDMPVEAPKKKKRKLFGRKPREVEAPAVVSDKTVEEVTAVLPPALEGIYQELAAWRKSIATAAHAADEYGRLKTRLQDSNFPYSQPTHVMAAWFAQQASQHKLVEDAAAAHVRKERESGDAYRRVRGIADTLAKVVKAVEYYDLSPFSPELLKQIAVTRVLVPELPVQRHEPSRSSFHPVKDSERKLVNGFVEAHEDARLHSTDLLSRDMRVVMLAAFEHIWNAAENVMTLKSAFNSVHEELQKAGNKPDVELPGKPTNPDVLAFLQAASDWYAAREEIVGRLEGARQELLPAVIDYIERLAALKAAYDEALEVALEDGRKQPGAELKAAGNAIRALEHISQSAQKYVSLPGKNKKTIEEDDVELAQKLREEAEAERAEADRTHLPALKATMRRLGFALAQRRAAADRLDAAKGQAVPPLTHEEPTFDIGNIDQYISRHGQWRKARTNQDASVEVRKGRLAGCEAQLKERREQVPQVAVALTEQLKAVKSGLHVSDELARVIAVATWLANEHKPEEAPAAKPANVTKAQEQARTKAKAKVIAPPRRPFSSMILM